MRGRAVAGAILFVCGLLPLPAVAGAVRAPVPGTSCDVFPADNVWNMDVSKVPVNPRSAVWKRAMHAGTTRLHPDFGPPGYGLPFDVVGHAHPDVRLRFTYAGESDRGPYPLGARTQLEQGSDRHALMIDADTCALYELFGASWNAGKPTAGSGAVFHLAGPKANDLRPAGWTSADAAGLPIFPGLLRWDEVRAGFIGHAIRFTAGCTARSYLWPARHQAGVADSRCPPMGARFRLRAGYSLAGFSRDARVILRAFQRYGLILADNGSDWFFQGEVSRRWTNDLLDELKSVPARAFVALDESGCRVKAGSAAFAYGRGCPRP